MMVLFGVSLGRMLVVMVFLLMYRWRNFWIDLVLYSLVYFFLNWWMCSISCSRMIFGLLDGVGVVVVVVVVVGW